MRAGLLRTPATIQKRSETVDSTGQRSTTWTDVVSALVEVQPLSGRELDIAQAVRSGATRTIVMRYHPGITAAMRLVSGSRIFSILDVVDVGERSRTLQLSCSEGLSDGL